MEYQWALDAPSGSFKNHLLSADIRYAAISETKFLQFCGRESGYGKHKGESVTITRIKNVAEPTSAVIPEGTTGKNKLPRRSAPASVKNRGPSGNDIKLQKGCNDGNSMGLYVISNERNSVEFEMVNR